jgi:hypothetical protein
LTAFWKDEEDKGMKVALMNFSDEPRALWIGDEKVYTQVRAMMYNNIHYPQTARHWQE